MLYELAPIPRVRLTTTFDLATDAGIGGSSIYQSAPV